MTVIDATSFRWSAQISVGHASTFDGGRLPDERMLTHPLILRGEAYLSEVGAEAVELYEGVELGLVPQIRQSRRER